MRKWLCQLLLALDYLQTQQVLHRDIKTSNLMLTCDSDVQLGDFGLATLMEEDGKVLLYWLYLITCHQTARPHQHRNSCLLWPCVCQQQAQHSSSAKGAAQLMWRWFLCLCR